MNGLDGIVAPAACDATAIDSDSANFHFTQRHHVFSCPNFTFDLDEYRRDDDQALIAQFELHDEVSLELLVGVLLIWRAFRMAIKAPVFTCVPLGNDAGTKLATMLGFRFLERTAGEDGTERDLFLNACEASPK